MAPLFPAYSDPSPRERVHSLDLIRGVLILGMICDHLLYDCTVILGVGGVLIGNPVRLAIHDIGAYMFVLLSGASSYISRNNLRRGLMLLPFALGLTLITYIDNRTFFVVFGILHCLSLCSIIYALARPLIDRIPQKLAPFFWIALAFVTRLITNMVRTGTNIFFMFGLHNESFASLDYYPIVPWIFVFFLGAWCGPYIFEHRLPEWFYSLRCDPLEKVGRYSLWIYILHQPILMFILAVLKEMYFR